MTTLTPSPIAVTRDVIYKHEPDHNLPLDIYEPSSYLATVVDIHGGGWFHGDKATDEDLATRLAHSGFRVVVPNYRLTPEHHFPVEVDDALDAGLRAQSTEREGSKRVPFLGSFAGGNLALEAAPATGQPDVSWSGPIYMANSIGEFVPPRRRVRHATDAPRCWCRIDRALIPVTQHAKGYMDVTFESSVTFLERTLDV